MTVALENGLRYGVMMSATFIRALQLRYLVSSLLVVTGCASFLHRSTGVKADDSIPVGEADFMTSNLPPLGTFKATNDSSPKTLGAVLASGKVLGSIRWYAGEPHSKVWYVCVAIEDPTDDDIEPQGLIHFYEALGHSPVTESDELLTLRYVYECGFPFGSFSVWPATPWVDNLMVTLETAGSHSQFVIVGAKEGRLGCLWAASDYDPPECVDLDNDGTMEVISTLGGCRYWDGNGNARVVPPDEAWIHHYVDGAYVRLVVVPWEDRLNERTFSSEPAGQRRSPG